ncbi:MAG: CPBP family glutamic-type intramembrane protease [Planctomycetota bacterium]
MSIDSSNPPPTKPAGSDSALARLDAWMAENPWHPRATPFFVYMIGMLIGGLIYDGSFGLPELPALIPIIYTAQVGIVCWLLWRYRALLPELNIKFHWLAVPTGIGLCFAWVYLGYASNWFAGQLVGIPGVGDAAAWLVPTYEQLPGNTSDSHNFTDNKEALGDAWYWTTMSLRLLGMSIAVPLFEELWVRSAVLRGAFNAGKTKTAFLQLGSDLPIIGEWISSTKAGQAAANEPPMFTQQLIERRVGQISLFAVCFSTFVFMLAHQRRDYLGCIACGVVWCWLVWWTNRPRKGETWADQPAAGRYGLGPIVWSHGITNACLWGWTLYTSDWQFL